MNAKRTLNAKQWMSQNSIWVVLIFMAALMSILSPTFLTAKNLVSVLTTESITGILAVGVMWCILSKGIDLSPGALVALTGVVTASLAQKFEYGASRLFPNLPDIPVVVAILAGLAVGTFFGVVNGLLIAYTKIPAFIATLGTQLIARALAQLYTNAYPIPELKPGLKNVAQFELFQISGASVTVIIIIFILFACISGFMLTQTRFGKAIFAIGGNDQAARVAGINVEKNIIKVYTWCAFCASVGGVLLAARSGAGNSSVGVNYELDAIAAATVGGTSHSGGVCRISGVIAGILIMGILKNGMMLLKISPYLQQVCKGIIIIAAVVFDMRKNAKKN
ncbi:MAG: hypothetical protein HFF97_08320 [Oscillibacter sp.]|jgi:ribose/xylose/arabinose/galactoside ABC-type transport system permease subunit|uniref:ABC transporter permease subunit n=1 Tax=uncultured Oscillibacter sp. TaxID=876091 RepID=UPI0021712747|nr:hypothetical protein [uncultured Oscillibacter sp.]MCI9644710.1 hypothetical protein [Oscillibacter sp.]